MDERGAASRACAQPGRAAVLRRYFALTWPVVLINEACDLRRVDVSGAVAALYAAAALGTGSFLLLLVVFLPVLGVDRLVPSSEDGPRRRKRDLLVYGLCVTLFTAMQGFVLLDGYVYGLYGFHFNGFVWSLVTTRGGVASMGAEASTYATSVLVALLIAAFQTGLLVAAIRIPRLRRTGEADATRRRALILASALVALLLFEKIAYGVSVFRSYGPVLTVSQAFPLYLPVSFSTFLRKLGFKDRREDVVRMTSGPSRLHYPLHPLEREDRREQPDIVWLVAESLRADMLDPAIMPATWGFSERALRFERHYSGGNGTRMGMFTMFYGLYGNSFVPCLAELRSPVLVDVLQDCKYQMFLHTSAAFSFPELDKTVFAKIPRADLHEGGKGEGWARDREHVGRILGEIDGRDPARPFFAFMFFESPHAPYNFPEECRIRTPVAPRMNYLTMDLKKDIGSIKNRYVNACRHLDTQVERLLKGLEERRLLDSTLVLITGDHGEEFMEKGRWGHHSAFTEEQCRVPLVLRMPGVPPARIDRMTSHLDLPATVLARLGVKNPSEDYSLGNDLVAGKPRPYAVISGWEEEAYVDDRYKQVFPLKAYDLGRCTTTTRDDAPADAKSFLAACRDRVSQLMKDLHRFQK